MWCVGARPCAQGRIEYKKNRTEATVKTLLPARKRSIRGREAPLTPLPGPAHTRPFCIAAAVVRVSPSHTRRWRVLRTWSEARRVFHPPSRPTHPLLLVPMADPTATMDGTTPPSPGGGGDHHADAPPAFPPADAVLAARAGDVLTAGTLLKSDHFPGCQNKRLASMRGAPNFRDVPGLPVYGLAIPTAAGARAVLDALGAASTPPRRVLWHNMREEPVVYINGAPYVVREAGAPFANLEYTGIDRTRVESMEARLKADVLREAAAWDGAVLVAHEAADFQVVAEWEAVTEADVQTPLELFGELASVDGYSVDYVRVPVTDEKAPKDADFAALLARAWRPPPGAALVFNCQMGRGRTTTGMVIAALVCLRRRAAELAGATTSDIGGDADQSLLALPATPVPGLPDWWASSAARSRATRPRRPPPPPSSTAATRASAPCCACCRGVRPPKQGWTPCWMLRLRCKT